VKRLYLQLCLLAATSQLVACSEPTQSVNETTAKVPAYWPKLDIQIKSDALVEQQVKQLLGGMTLEQKVAQTIQPEIRDITVEDMRQYGFGSYLNGGGAFPNNDKHATPQDWIAHAQAMYLASVDDALDGSSIPTMWGTDAVHGHNNVIGATLFPHNIGLGAAHNPSLLKQIAKATAAEVMATGIDWIFAPTVATVQDDRWGRTYESYSEDPTIIRKYSAAIVEGLQGDPKTGYFNDDNVIATVKHFIGDGGTEKGDDQGNNMADEQTLFELHAQGYVGGLSAGAQSVMASFNSWQGSKVHGNSYLLTDVLKNRMGFDGFVVGDWNGHGQVAGCTNENCPQAMNAGLDIYMVATSAWKPLYENTLAQVRSGVIPLSRLDDAVSRILRVKIRAGLFTKPAPAERKYANMGDVIGSPAHRDIARQAVRESLVLLKNNQHVLPIAPHQRILVAGDGADNIGKQSGGWSITWQGTGNTNSDFPGGSSIYQGIKAKVEAAGGQVELSEMGQFSQKPDVAIVVFGEEPYAEGNGDIDNLEYQRGNKRDLALLLKLKAQGIPTVSIFLSGRPLWVNPELNASDAFVAAWLPGSEGQGVADVIIAEKDGTASFDFSGRLSFSWPKSPVQSPLNFYDEDYQPLFALGYGLSYSSHQEVSDDLSEVSIVEGATVETRKLFDRSAIQPWQAGITENGQFSAMSSNTLLASSIQVRTQDRRVQEDSLRISWSDNTRGSFVLNASFPEDLRTLLEQQASLQFDIQRLSDGDASISVGMQCGEGCGASIELKGERLGAADTWQTISIDLNCFAKQGMNYANVFAPLVIQASEGVSLGLSDVSIVPHTAASASLTCQP
jgi:beta-glucosidase